MKIKATIDGSAAARWKSASGFDWGDVAGSCGVCGEVFDTGDLQFVFGDPMISVARKVHLCAKCGISTMGEGELRPSALSIFVREGHRELEFVQLPEHVRKRLANAFRIVDEISEKVVEEAKRSTS